MGTNYYLRVNENDVIHLGKACCGWYFLWDIISILQAVRNTLDNTEQLNSLLDELIELIQLHSHQNPYTLDNKNDLIIRQDLTNINIDKINKLVQKHPWYIKYKDIYIVDIPKIGYISDHCKSLGKIAYIQIEIPLLSEKQIYNWIKQLLLLDNYYIVDEYGNKYEWDEFISNLNNGDLDLISYAKKYQDITRGDFTTEFVIESLKCSFNADFS